VFFGLDSVLDFRLAEGVFGDRSNAPLRDVIKGATGPETLLNRLEAQRNRALNRGELGRYLVTFVDNHDSFWQRCFSSTTAAMISLFGPGNSPCTVRF
jgi:alpha-amylase